MKHLLSYVVLMGLVFTQNPVLFGNNSINALTLKKEMLLVEAISLISRDYNVYFTFDHELVQDIKVQYETRKDQSVEAAISGVLSGTDLKFKLYDQRFVILYQNDKKGLESLKELVKHFEHIIADGPEKKAARQIFKPVSSIPLREAWIPPARKIKNLAINVSGTVTDQEGALLIGVNVQVKGTNKGTATDFDGMYTLSDVNENAILVFSYVGYQTQELPVDGRSTVDITMLSDAQLLDEVVVTALGIKKENRSLGYAASQVSSEELSINRTPNLMNALTGKLPGVNISGLGTGPGGTSKIRIRGQSSISGQNSPLIVVNGIPIDNTNFGSNPGNRGSDSSIGARGGGNTSDGGDGLSSINPDDIESMTILKGAAASALYGSRAKDGVIMITTKTIGSKKGIGISYNMNFTTEKILDYTNYQYEYGQGEHGSRPTSPNPTSGQWSFGERFQPGMTQILFDGIELPYEPQRGIMDQFFRNGNNFTNTVTLSTNGNEGGIHLSLSNMNNKGIVPNNIFKRNIANFGFTYNLTDKLSFQGNINYSYEDNDNPPVIAEQDNSIPTALYAMANSMPMDVLRKNRYGSDGDEAIWSRFKNRTNPYFILSDEFQNIRRDRLIGNLSIKYDLFDWLFVQGRVGQDYWSRDQDYTNYPTGKASRSPAPAGFVNGVFTQESRRFRELNVDFLVSASKQISDFGMDLTVGGNQMKRRSDLNSVLVTDFVVRGLYTVQNGRSKDPVYSLSERGVNSVYGAAGLSYKSFLYLNGTLRNDWFSTLSPANRSILYPSLSASYVFSENFSGGSNWFGKFRAAYAEVGSDTDVPPYSNTLFYGINSNLIANPQGNLQPVGGSSGNTVPNPNLRPMRTSETEIGLEMRLLDNRFKFDLSVYHKITSDQIVQAQISDASGFVDTRINRGESQNNGVELFLNIVPIQTNKFDWNFSFAGSYNKTKVLSLLTDEPGESITVGTHVFNGELRQIVGKEMGQIAGFGYKRNAVGQIIFGSNGLPLRTDDLISFGSALPRWTGGFANAFNFNKLSFSFLIDFKLGNKILSGTNFNAIRHGHHKITLEGREGGVIGDGVNEAGEMNSTLAPIQTYWEVIRSKALVEPVIYEGGFWKLRQVTMGYDFSNLVSSTVIQGLSLDLVANNVFLIKKWIDNIDLESFGYSSDNLVGLEGPTLPTTRSIGFNLNIKF